MDTAVDLKFADGEYRFWLPWPQVFELERKCGYVGHDGGRRPKSIFQIFNEMGELSANALDIKETIRLGLIGGNHGLVDGEEIKVGPLTAAQIVEEYVYPARPLDEAMQLAATILHAAIAGVDLKKKAVTEAEANSQNPSEKAQ
ncbi:MAG: GTA-gp10 family protein [Pseudomonadota bacterium]